MVATVHRIVTPNGDRLRAEIAVIGSGPGGAITAALLAESGRDVMLIEEGPNLSVESAPAFSRAEIVQKYRNGGVTVAMGGAKVVYAEGRCVGGGSEINRGLYVRTPSETLEAWHRDFRVEATREADLEPHFEACEEAVGLSYLPAGAAPPASLKLAEGAASLGWDAMEVPRLFRYESDGREPRKQSMTQTFLPRYLKAGGQLLPDTKAMRLRRHGARWELRAEYCADGVPSRQVDIAAETVFVACGAIQTPVLLRRSRISRSAGNSLRFHPMVKVVARFPEEVNLPGAYDPVHQIKEFCPRFSMGCSINSPATIALAMADHPEQLPEVDRDWRKMAVYYAEIFGGNGTVRTLPGFRDPLVRVRFSPWEMTELGEALRKLCQCLFAAGAVALYPGISGSGVLKSEADLEKIPEVLPLDRTNLMALHLFSTCPMGEDRSRCVTDSFGRVHGADGLYIADASLLCRSPGVNPQGSIMAIAHRNVLEYLPPVRLFRARRQIATRLRTK